MNDEQMRDQLVAALVARNIWQHAAETYADTLLPVVRQLVRQAQIESLHSAAEFFASRLPDGTGNGRAYNSYRVAQLLESFADNLRE